MKPTRRRVELIPKVLAACQYLIGRDVYPTGRNLRVLCRGAGYTTLVEVRDHLIETGQISVVQFWPSWTDRVGVSLGPPAVGWPASTDRHRWGLEGGNRNWSKRQKRRDARRTAEEVSP